MAKRARSTRPAPDGASPPSWRDDSGCRAAMVYGWTALTLFIVLGVVLESFHLLKTPLYLEVRLRRELWTLAHAHGTLLALVNVAFALTAYAAVAAERARLRASRLVRAGAILVPVGFFLGGVGSAEGDPSLAILLVPLGAVLTLMAAGMVAWGLLRR